MEFSIGCPGCNNSFHIRLDDKTLIRIEGEPVTILPPEVDPHNQRVKYRTGHELVEFEKLEFKFKCHVCGREWEDETRSLHALDPLTMQPLPPASFFERRLLSPFHSLVTNLVFALAFIYPMTAFIYPWLLLNLGVKYGLLVFWSSYLGTVLVFWLVIRVAGLSRNFAGRDTGYHGSIIGAVGGGVLTVLVFISLPYLGIAWTVSIMAGILIVSLIVSIRIIDRR